MQSNDIYNLLVPPICLMVSEIDVGNALIINMYFEGITNEN